MSFCARMDSWDHLHRQDPEKFSYPEEYFEAAPLCSDPPAALSPWQPLTCSLFLRFCLFQNVAQMEVYSRYPFEAEIFH